MAQEEISLTSGDPVSTPKAPLVSKQKPEDQDPKDPNAGPSISKRAGKLADLLSPSTTEQELVDIIGSASDDRHRPWEQCRLPSLGLYYPTWGGQDSCEVRPFGIDIDQILATQRLAQDGTALNLVFDKCCRFVDPEFNALELLAGDRVFLLYYLRGITHGESYEFIVNCPKLDCKAQSTHTYNLMALANTIKFANPALGKEPYRVDLPHLSASTGRPVWAGVRFVRGRDTNNIQVLKKTQQRLFAQPAGQRQRREPTVDETLTENLEMVIQSINGVTDRQKISAVVSKLHATDTATIREWLRNNAPGIDTVTEITCPECSTEFKIPLPITESFFRPTPLR